MNRQSKSLLKMGVSVGTAVFLFLALFVALNATVLASPDAPTALNTGDIAIIGINADSDDNFAFVALVDLPTGTEIRFTDSGWQTTNNTFRGNEGAVKYTAPSNIDAGTIVELIANSADFIADNDAIVGNNGLVLSTSGDQVIAFQGLSSAPSFIYAAQTNSTQWQVDSNSSNESDLPPGLVDGTTAVAVGSGPGPGDEYDNSVYSMVTTEGTQAELLAVISNASNWNGDNLGPISMPSGSFTVNTIGSLLISKVVEPQTAVPYQSPVTYTVVLENSGAVDETAVLFTDTLPASTTFNSWVEQPPTGTSEAGDEITWTGTVTAGKSITFTFTADQDADYSETITNTAEFSGTNTADTAQATFTVEEEPLLVDLIVEKMGPQYGVADETINYTVVISNDGSLLAENVVFTDTFPAEISYVSDDSGYTPSALSGNVYVWELGNLASETAVTINLTGTVANSITSSVLVTNTAETSTTTAGDDLSTNESEAYTTLTPLVTIYDIQYTTDASGDSPYKDQSVTTEGIVTAIFNNETFIQDGDGAWNGVMLYKPSGSVSIGDYIQVTGKVIEYYGMTEFAFGAQTTVISSGNTLPAFESLATGDMSDEPYESVLVQANNAVVTDDALGYGEWAINDGSGDIAVDEIGSYSYSPTNDDILLYVRGPLNYSYSAFKIAARDDDDIALGISISKEAPASVSPGDLFTYTLTVNNQLGETLNNVVISDVVPANTTFAYALNSGTESAGTVTWNIASVPHASNVSVQFAVTATNSIAEAKNDTYIVYADNAPDPVAGAPVTTFILNQLHIYHVQGEGFVSPIVGHEVTVSGQVVADFQGDAGMKGFFIQDVLGDGNMLTSDGIFVDDDDFGVDVNLGDIVTVTGEVAEYQNNTQLTDITAVLTQTGTTPLDPTVITLPETVNGDLERYEGMWVTIQQDMTVAQNYFQGRYGQVTLSANGRLFQPTNVYTPTSTEAIDLADSNTRNLIVLDDGSTASNPNPVPYMGTNTTLRAGDIVSGGNLFGVLDEGRINSSSPPGIDYRFQPRQTGNIIFQRINERANTPANVGGRLQIASFNVLNYFTTFGSRGAGNQFEFDRQRTKIITAIVALDADVVGLMEIENNDTEAIEDLVTGLNTEAGAGTYAYIDSGIVGSDEIKVAMIYQPAKVTPVGTTAVLTDVFPFNTNTRPPLAQAFSENETGSEFIVVVNHFKSKGSPCDSVSIPDGGTWIDPDLGDGQGNCNKTRELAANELVQWLDTDPTGTGDPDIFIIGDLNAYAQEDPITALKDHGYLNLIEQFSGTSAYSYIFDGMSGYLDHGLASSSAQTAVTGATEWHINADEPSALDYNDYNPAYLYQPDAFRASDHDPVLIGINLPSPDPTVTILSPMANEVFTSTDGTAVSVPVIITTTNFGIPTDGNWHVWVDGTDMGEVQDYDTTVNLLPGGHVISATLYDPTTIPLGIMDSVSVTVVELLTPTVSILNPMANEVFTSTNGTAVSVPVTITTTNFVIPTDGHWHIWVDGTDMGPVMDYDTTVNLLPGGHVITAELNTPAHAPLGIIDTVSVTVNAQYTVYLPIIMKP